MDTNSRILERFLGDHTEVAIELIEELEIKDIANLIIELSPNQGKIILSEISSYQSGKVIENLPLELSVALIELVNPKKAETILRVTRKDLTSQILSKISVDLSTYLKNALKYSEDQVGAHMEPLVLTLTNRLTADAALTLIKGSDATVRTEAYVLNSEKTLVGYITLNELLKAEPSVKLTSLLKPAKHAVNGDTIVSDLLANWKSSFNDLPVIKLNGVFLGTVSKNTLQKLTRKPGEQDKSALQAGKALGDLYLIGLTSLLGSTSEPLQSKN